MFEFTSGLIAIGFLMAGIFFLRYWRQTRDGLFAAFATAFALLALNQTLLAPSRVPVEERSPLCLVQVTALGIIIAAVLAKNIAGPPC